jgi:acyl dehydratase
MIDRRFIGHARPATFWEVEKGRLRAFAKATGETRSEYLDTTAARDAGHASLPAPPTVVFGADLDSGATQDLLVTLGVDIANILHGEQSFTYLGPIHAGDLLRLETRITDIVSKRGGAMEFITKVTDVINQRDQRVLEMRSVIVVRHPAQSTESQSR